MAEKDYKYFLGSVGSAEALRRKSDGTYEVAFVSKTLTDSGINISTTKDDIRGGQGAPIQFSFYHDPSVEINLTDIVWKADYLEAQLGAEFDRGGDDYVTKTVTFENGVSTNEYEAKALKFYCGEGVLAWGRKAGSNDKWETISWDSDTKKFKLADANGDYCVRYLTPTDKVQIAEINSLIVPEELFLIIEAPIFAGDACSASKGKAAGHISFEIPRFQLNGSQEFSFNMSSNQTMSLSGIALASESAECNATGGTLLRVREYIEDFDALENVIDLVPDPETLVAGLEPTIYGITKDSDPYKIDNSKLTFTPALTGGKLDAGSYSVTITKVEGKSYTTREAEFTVA